MAAFSRGIPAGLLVLWMAAAGFAADRVIVVLDASGSMWGQIDGKPKLRNRAPSPLPRPCSRPSPLTWRSA